MKSINVSLNNLSRVTRTNAVDIQAKFEPARLTVRLRNRLIRSLEQAYIPSNANRLIRSLEQAYIPSNAYWGVGLVAKELLDQAGVFYMNGKTRGYIWVQWSGSMPREIREAINEVLVADHAAATVQGMQVDPQQLKSGDAPYRHFYMRVLKPHQHIVPILKPYAETPAYKSAVAPYIEAIRSGQPIVINVKH